MILSGGEHTRKQKRSEENYLHLLQAVEASSGSFWTSGVALHK